MNPTNPKEFRYIKLGHGGSWTQPAFERGELHFGYRTLSHDLCLQGDWEAVTRSLTEAGRSLGKARDAVREIRDFYTLGSDCLWITFADGHLWWAFAEPEVTWLGVEEDGQGARMEPGRFESVPQFGPAGLYFRRVRGYWAAALDPRRILLVPTATVLNLLAGGSHAEAV